MARNTVLLPGQSLSRSLGVHDDHEVVVRILGEGRIEIRKLPLRKLKRNEKLFTAVHAVSDLLECENARDSAVWLDPLIEALPVAEFNGPPEKVGYLAKVWILNKLKQLREK